MVQLAKLNWVNIFILKSQSFVINLTLEQDGKHPLNPLSIPEACFSNNA